MKANMKWRDQSKILYMETYSAMRIASAVTGP